MSRTRGPSPHALSTSAGTVALHDDPAILFFDDLALNLLDNVVRRTGRPQRILDAIYRDPAANPQWGFPSVFRDPTSDRWRMTYCAWDREWKRYPLLADSADGLAWTPTDTTSVWNDERRTYPHQAFFAEGYSEWPTAVVDPFAPPGERIKGLVIHHPNRLHITTSLWTSADGVRWRQKPGVEWQRIGSDPGTFVFRDRDRGAWSITSRPDWTDRRIAISRTADWVGFSEPELLLQADALDEPLTEIYGLPVIPYGGIYVGLLWLYHTVPQVEGASPHKFKGGHVDCQLAYSLNGSLPRCLHVSGPWLGRGLALDVPRR